MRGWHSGITSSVLCVALGLITSAAPSDKQPAIQLPHHVAVQTPPGMWFENIAVRPNGKLLLTTLAPNASIYEVSNPAVPGKAQLARLVTVPGITSLVGITETSPDTYAFIGGNFTATGGVKGSWSIWTANFHKNCDQPEVKVVAHLPDALLPNGATTVLGNKDLILVADSFNGLVYHVNLATGQSEVSQDFTEMKSGSDKPTAVGINGLHIRAGYLYWTNSVKHTFFRVKVTNDGHTAPDAHVETVAVLNTTFLDDFSFGPGHEDIAWVASNTDNTLLAVNRHGKSMVVAGGTDSFTVAKSTACQFGRTKDDKKILYVTTGGQTINGVTEGAKVEVIDTSGFSWAEN